jgi:threonylcarbamoyladenosine tRNA methylthiotransferase MtaB
MSKKTVTLLSQGCRLNHAETANLINEFVACGYSEVALDKQPDVVVINTCTVTENGDKDTLKLVRKINKASKTSKIALIGCQSQIKKDSLLNLENVEWVIGNQEKKETVNLIATGNSGVHVTPFKKESFTQPYSSFDPRHTRVNLKIQDGCDFYCAFCIIPFARGPARSREFNNVLDDAKALIQLGVKELVLTGINLGTYECKNETFYSLLRALLELSPNTRIRISSIEPTTIGQELINIWHEYPNLCRYLHLPIQSATNTVLNAMRRKYTLEAYNEYLQQVVDAVPNMCVGTDVIVGFPGETDTLFNQTVDYLTHAPIHYFHVFSYSERTMAHSRKFDDKVSAPTIKERSATLRALSKDKWHAYREHYKTEDRFVLFETTKGDDWVGSTEHFVKVKVKVKSKQSLKNQMHRVKLHNIDDTYVHGELVHGG